MPINRYKYPFNNPIRFTDPSGNNPDWVWENGQYVKKYETPIQRRNRLFRAHKINSIDGAGLPKSENDPLLSMDRMMMRIQERSSFVMKSMFNKQLEYQLQREILKILLEEKSVVPILNISSGKDKLVLLDEFNETDLAFDDIAGSDKTGAPSDEALATFTERMNILSHQWAKDAVANLEGPKGGGGYGNKSTLTGSYKEGLDGFTVAASVVNAAVHMADQPSNNFKSLGASVSKKFIPSTSTAAKITGTIGHALGLISFGNDVANIYNKGFSNATFANYAKLGISLGMLGLKANPVNFGISIGYGLLDAAGYNPVDLIYNNATAP